MSLDAEAGEVLQNMKLPGRIISWAGHRGRELAVIVKQSRIERSCRRVLVLPSSGYDGGSSELRAWRMAEGLSRLGWNCTVMPTQLEQAQRIRIARRFRPDILLVQQARHPLNRVSLLFDRPFVFDIDDADFVDPAMEPYVRECCISAKAVIAGSEHIGSWCRGFNKKVRVVWTGAAVPKSFPHPLPESRRPILTWAQSSPSRYPLERAFVGEVLCKIRDQTNFEFWLYGVDRRQGVQDLLKTCDGLKISVRMFEFMDYGKFLQSLTKVAVGMQPVCTDSLFSRGKSFGKVLAYLASGVAIVASDAGDHSLFFKDGQNGHLANSSESWANGVCRLLENSNERGQIARNAWESFRRELSLEAAAAKVDSVLRDAIALN